MSFLPLSTCASSRERSGLPVCKNMVLNLPKRKRHYVALGVFAPRSRPRLNSVIKMRVKQVLGNCEWSIEPRIGFEQNNAEKNDFEGCF